MWEQKQRPLQHQVPDVTPIFDTVRNALWSVSPPIDDSTLQPCTKSEAAWAGTKSTYHWRDKITYSCHHRAKFQGLVHITVIQTLSIQSLLLKSLQLTPLEHKISIQQYQLYRSPHLTMASYTSPPSLNTSHTTVTSNLPPSLDPASLDTLPVLTSILTRLQSTSPTTHDTSSPHHSQPLTQSLSQSQTQTLTQTQLTSSPSFTTTTSGAHSQDKFPTTPLTTKDIPSATDGLKHRLQKARAQVAVLPDIHRGLEEQEQEIKELEDRIREQRAVLERLKRMGAAQDTEEKMDIDS